MEKTETVINLIGEQNQRSKSTVNLSLSSNHNPQFCIKIRAIVLPKITSAIPNEDLSNHCFDYLKHLQLADPTFYKAKKIDLLLGSDVGIWWYSVIRT